MASGREKMGRRAAVPADCLGSYTCETQPAALRVFCGMRNSTVSPSPMSTPTPSALPSRHATVRGCADRRRVSPRRDRRLHGATRSAEEMFRAAEPLLTHEADAAPSA